MSEALVEIPNIEWYLAKSRANGSSHRCPFASAETCPRFYQSLSLLGSAGSTQIPEKEDKVLLKKWKKSPLWPITDEQETSISGKNKIFSKFCPEVSYEQFKLFAANLCDYSNEDDRGNAHSELSQLRASREDWRWRWAAVEPQHYTECPYYSLLLNSNSSVQEPNEDIIDIKPNFCGMGINFNALFRKLMKWFRK